MLASAKNKAVCRTAKETGIQEMNRNCPNLYLFCKSPLHIVISVTISTATPLVYEFGIIESL